MLNRLFSPTKEFNDGFTQTQREAIVDLLHFCMFADSRIVLSESRFIAANVKELNWDPAISFESYQGKSIGAARAALGSSDARMKFLREVSARLATKDVRQQAFDLCQKLFATDGSKASAEFAVQGEVRSALGL